MYEIYCQLKAEKGCKDADVVRATGITKSTFSDWKSGRSKPKGDKLIKIADFFGVSVEYLTTGIDPQRSDIANERVFTKSEIINLFAGTNAVLEELVADILEQNEIKAFSEKVKGNLPEDFGKPELPTTIAAHFDGSEFTEEELDEIRNFAEFVKNKRK